MSWFPVTGYINILLVDLIGQQNCCAVVSSAVTLLAVKNAKGDRCVSIRRQTNDRKVSLNKLAEAQVPKILGVRVHKENVV